jgi:hypothetical protein
MPALGLYLFLVTVADADGLSWYSDVALSGVLSCDIARLQSSRTELEEVGLIAYRKPLYQVLDLAPTGALRVERPGMRSIGRNRHANTTEAVPIGSVLQSILAPPQGGA